MPTSAPTGSRILDDLLGGGIPRGSSVILRGPAGEEKETIAWRFLKDGWDRGEAAIVALSSMSPRRFRERLSSLGVDAKALEESGRLVIIDWFTHRESAITDVVDEQSVLKVSVDLTNVGVAINWALNRIPKGTGLRAVFEVLSPALNAFDLQQVFQFAQIAKAKLERRDATALFLIEKEMHDPATLSNIEQPFDGVIDIERVREGDRIVRKIGVPAMRGAPMASAKYVALEIDMPGAGRPSTPPSPTPETHGGGAEAERVGPVFVPSSAEEGRNDERIAALAHAANAILEGDPGNLDALFAKAATLAHMGQWSEALASANDLTRIEVRYPGVWVLKATIYEHLGKPKLAASCRDRATELHGKERLLDVAPQPSATARAEHPQTATKPEASVPSAAPRGKSGPRYDAARDLTTDSRAPTIAPAGRSAAGLTNGRTNGRVDGRGRTNGLVRGRGRTNGLVNGRFPPGLADGRTNGLVNGRGRTNGLVNGQGRTNGLVNGLANARRSGTDGLTNGMGLTNGLGGARFPRDVRAQRWKLTLIPAMAFALLIATLLAPVDLYGPTEIVIDGNFADWPASSFLAMSSSAQIAPGIDVVRLGIMDRGLSLAFYVEVAGPVLQGGGTSPSLMDTILILVDADGSATTGYEIDGLGADRMIEVSGINGEIRVSQVSEFDDSRGRQDWIGWTKRYAIPAAVRDSRMELAADWLLLGSNLTTVSAGVRTQSWDGQIDRGDAAIGLDRGTMLLVQQAQTPELLLGPGVPLLSLSASAGHQAVTFDTLNVQILGTAPASASTFRLLDSGGAEISAQTPLAREVRFAFSPETIPVGSTRTYTVVADISGGTGGTFGVHLSPGNPLGTATAVVTVRDAATARWLGYAGLVPAEPRIDGGFAEWNTSAIDPVGDPETRGNTNIDLRNHGGRANGSSLHLFADVEGRIFAGTPVPRVSQAPPVPTTSATADSDRDTVPDAVDPLRDDFNNDGTPDAQTNGDVDGDGITDYGIAGGTDVWLNTTIPISFPLPYGGRGVSVYIGPDNRPSVTGDDVLRFFLDTDNQTGTGYAIAGIGANRLVEVRGKGGSVTQSAVLNFNGSFPGEWAWTPSAPVTVATSGRALELAVTFNAARLYLEAGDFWGGVDATAAGPALAPAPGGAFVGAAPNSFATAPAAELLRVPWEQVTPTPAETPIDPSSNAITTQYNHQRKVVRAGDAPGDTACDATNSDGCWYVVFYDQLLEVSANTQASTETATTGSKISGTFPGDIQTQNDVYIQYREAADVEAEIAYKSNTGANAESSPKTRDWSSSTWGGEAELNTAGSAIRAVRMAFSPVASTTRIIVTVSTDGFLDAYVCGTSCSVTNDIGQVWTSVPTTYEYFDVAFETLGGEAILVYSVVNSNSANDLAYRTWIAGTWSSEQYIDDTSNSGDLVYATMDLASEKAGNRIGLIAHDDTNDDANAWIWDGSAWGNFAEITASADAGVMYYREEIAWEAISGHLVAVATVDASTDCAYREYTTLWISALTFQCGATGSTGERNLRLKPNPAGNDMVLGSVRNDFVTNYWDGGAWSNRNTQDSGLDSNSEWRAFDFAWEASGSKGLLVYGTTPGQITYRTFTAPNTWGAATNVAMGSGSHPIVGLATNPAPQSGDTKILGAVMQDGATDPLGGIRWDGTTFTVIGTSTFTTDVGSTNAAQPFDIEYRLAAVQLEVRYGWTAVPSGDSYTLQVKGYRGDENIDVQVLTPPSTWNTRYTISASSNTLYTYILTSSEYNSGAPAIRFADAVAGAGTLSDVWIDYANIASNTHWDRIILRRSSDITGSTWGSPIILASGLAADAALLLTRDSAEPSIAIDAGGFLHVVWVSASAAGNQQTMNLVRYTKSTVAYPTESQIASAGNWEAVTNVDDASPGYMPTVSTDTSNNPHIAWSGSKTSGTVFYKNKAVGAWKPTVSWGAPSTSYTGLSVDVSPQNSYVSLVRTFENADAEVVYRNSGACAGVCPSNRSWDGSTWSAETQQSDQGSTIELIREAWSPTSFETRIIAKLGSDGFIDVYVCTPTCAATSNVGQVPTPTPTIPVRPFDIAYEQTSGEVLLVYGVISTNTARDIAYRTYVGGSWSAEQYLDDTTDATDIQYTLIRLASKPGSNQIGLIGGDDTKSDVNAWIWDGSAWGSNTEVTASGGPQSREKAAIAWESNSGHLLAVAVEHSNPNTAPNVVSKEYTTSWSAATSPFLCSVSGTVIYWVSLKPNPLSTANDMILVTANDEFDGSTCYWTGTAWANLNIHVLSLSANLNQRPIDFAWESTGGKGLLVFGRAVAKLTYRTFTAADAWGTVTDVAYGSGTVATWIQLRTNPLPLPAGGTKILGAVLDANNALGAVRWDGSTFTVIGATTLSADTGSDSEVFVLEYSEAGNAVQYVVCKNLAVSNCDAASEFTKSDGTSGHDWVATDVESNAYPSLATTYEANGDLWVAYAQDVDGLTRAIRERFLDYPAATWAAAENVDSLSGTTFARPSIGIDKDNVVHAFYVATAGPQLYYNVRTGGSWGARTAIGTSSDNPTLMVRAPSDATYGIDEGGLFWKSTTSETYFHMQLGIPEFEFILVPVLGIFMFGALRLQAARRRRVRSPERSLARGGGSVTRGNRPTRSSGRGGSSVSPWGFPSRDR